MEGVRGRLDLHLALGHDQSPAGSHHPIEHGADLDDELAAYAIEHTATQTNRWLARRIERIEADVSAQRHTRAMKDRHVRVSDAGDGMSWLSVLTSTFDAEAAAHRIDADARSLPADDPRTHDQACADILTGLLLGSSDPDETTDGVKTVIGIPSRLRPSCDGSIRPRWPR